MTPLSAMYLNVSAHVALATSSVRSISCSPSSMTSGSTIGTRPACWQMAAYRARPYAQSRCAIIDGPAGMETTERHLAKRAPAL